MYKKRKPSLNYKKRLTPRDYAEYKMLKNSIERKQTKQRLSNLRKQVEFERRTSSYDNTRIGKFAGTITRTLGTIGQKKRYNKISL